MGYFRIKENLVFILFRQQPIEIVSVVDGGCSEMFLDIFLPFFILCIMSDVEISDSDDSYHPEEEIDESESEDYSSMESDIHESDEESFISLGGGWSRVDVFTHANTHTHTHTYIYIYIYIFFKKVSKESSQLI